MSDWPDWGTAVPTGALALAVDTTSVPSFPSSHAATHAADDPSARLAPSETTKAKPRPKMRPPPSDDDEPLLDATLAQQPKAHHRTPAVAPALDPDMARSPAKVLGPVKAKATGAVLVRGTPSTTEVSLPSPPSLPQLPYSAAGASAPVPAQRMPQPQVPTSDLKVKKRSAPEAELELEAPSKKPRARAPVAKPPRTAVTATTPSGSPVSVPGPSATGPAARKASLRSSKAAIAAAAAIEHTNTARITGASQTKGKGKKQAVPSPPMSGLLERRSEEPSENDNGFHSLEEDE